MTWLNSIYSNLYNVIWYLNKNNASRVLPWHIIVPFFSWWLIFGFWCHCIHYTRANFASLDLAVQNSCQATRLAWNSECSASNRHVWVFQGRQGPNRTGESSWMTAMTAMMWKAHGCDIFCSRFWPATTGPWRCKTMQNHAKPDFGQGSSHASISNA